MQWYCIISRFICTVDVAFLHTGRECLVFLESIAIFPAVGQYIHKQFLYVSVQIMIFDSFYHPIAVQIHQNQNLKCQFTGKFVQHCIDEPKKVSREAFICVMGHNSLKVCICGLSEQHSFRNYDVPTENFAVSCSVSFNNIVNILGRYPIAEFLQVLLLQISSQPF